MLIDSVQSYGSLVLKCCVYFQRKELNSAILTSGNAAFMTGHCKTNTTIFTFPLFSEKQKSSLNLFQLAKTGSNIGLL